MQYWLTWVILNFVYRVFFKRIYILDYKNLPRNKPVILVANHSNSFLDSILLAANLKQGMWYLARGDVFKKPLAAKAMRGWHMYPIHRQKDGVDAKTLNDKVFSSINKLIAKNRIVMIFPEGNCIPAKEIRPFKKGAARMAFGFMEETNWDMDLCVVPVSINYTHHKLFRTEAFVHINKPVKVKDFHPSYVEHPNKGLVKLTQSMYDGIKENLILVSKEIESVAEPLLHIYRNNFSYHQLSYRLFDKTREQGELRLTRNLQNLFDNDQAKFDAVAKQIESYSETIKVQSLTDFGVAKQKVNLGLNQLLCLLLPLFWPINAFNKWILKFSNGFIKKNIKDPQFNNSIRLGLIIGFWIGVVILTSIIGIIIGNYYWIKLPLIAYLYGYLGTNLHFYYREVMQIRKAKSNNAIDELYQQRLKLVSIVDELIAES